MHFVHESLPERVRFEAVDAAGGVKAIPAAVEDVLAVVPASNPTPVTTENLTALLHAAWAGEEI